MMNISPFGVVSFIFHFFCTHPTDVVHWGWHFSRPQVDNVDMLLCFYVLPAPSIIVRTTWDSCKLPIATLSRESSHLYHFLYIFSQTKPCYNLRFNLPSTLQRGKRPRCGGKYSLEECPRKDKGTWVRTRLMSEILFWTETNPKNSLLKQFFLWIFSVRFLIGGKLYQFREKRAGSTPWASENTHLLNQLSIKGKWCFLSKVNGNVFLMKNVRSSFKNSLCKVFSVENKLPMSYFQNTCGKLAFKGSNLITNIVI